MHNELVKFQEEAFEKLKNTEVVKFITEQSKLKVNISNFSKIAEVTTEIINFDNNIIEMTFFICLKNDFPLSLPKIYLSEKDYERIKYIPHIDCFRFICTFDSQQVQLDTSNPSGIVLESFSKAKDIVEDGLKKANFSDFFEEFTAYWEQIYSNDDKINLNCLSFIKQQDNFHDITCIFLEEKINSYKIIAVIKNSEDEKYIKNIILKKKITFSESRPLFLDNFDINIPPFDLTNEKVIKLFQNKNKLKQFENYINLNKKTKIVLFIKQDTLFGWIHNEPKKIQLKNGFSKSKKIQDFQIISFFQKKENVVRLSFNNLNEKRINYRTEGSQYTKANKYIFTVAGLGSIGSNLIFFLKSLNNPELKLIDNDILSIENINRHYLGFNYCGFNKTDAFKSYFDEFSPFIKVEAKNESIVNIIHNEIEFINNSDFLFISIGINEVDNFIGKMIQTKNIKIPTFFIWVEPYLIGGHCLYINPNETCSDYFNFYSKKGMFLNNIISEEEYYSNNPSLLLKESGCQTTFIPFSLSNITLFLSCLFPFIKNIISEKVSKNQSFTWVGDTDICETLNIKLSTYSINKEKFRIYTND